MYGRFRESPYYTTYILCENRQNGKGRDGGNQKNLWENVMLSWDVSGESSC